MRQGYISKSLEGLEFGLIVKHNLFPYVDNTKDTLFLGLYREEDFNAFNNHIGSKKVVFFGSDALDIPKDFDLGQVEVIANSERVAETLKSKGFDVSSIIPVNPTISEQWECVPNGDSLYWYGGNYPEFYGVEIVDKLEKKLSIEIIRTEGQYNQAELKDIYKECFLNLRLTPHDGCPNTNLQMGLMGRKSIYNGNLPCSISWDSNDIDSLCRKIEDEYKLRKKDNSYISEQFINFNKKSYL